MDFSTHVLLKNTIEYGNFYYFLFVGILLASIVAVGVLCYRFGPKLAKPLVTVLVWANFALHFLKVFTPYLWEDFPLGLVRIGTPNLCAAFVLFAPFVFHFGNKYFKDYFYYMGLVSGIVACVGFVGPIGIMGEAGNFSNPAYVIEVIRYYCCHGWMAIAAVALVAGRLHALNYHRLWAFPLIFALYYSTTFLQGVIMGPIFHHPWYPQEFFGPDGVFNRLGSNIGALNEAMPIGPGAARDEYFSWMYRYTIPFLQSYQAFGTTQFVPVLWSVPMVYVVVAILGIPLSLPFDFERIAQDFRSLRGKVKQVFHHNKA